jgi:hypothetical protein
MAKKATKQETEARINQVYDWILANEPANKMIQKAAEKWGVGSRSVYNYIQRANELIAEQAESNRSAEFGKAMARLNGLYNRALKVMDLRLALDIVKEISKLLALYQPTHVEVTGKDGGPIEHSHQPDLSKLTDSELDALEQIAQRLRSD